MRLFADTLRLPWEWVRVNRWRLRPIKEKVSRWIKQIWIIRTMHGWTQNYKFDLLWVYELTQNYIYYAICYCPQFQGANFLSDYTSNVGERFDKKNNIKNTSYCTIKTWTIKININVRFHLSDSISKFWFSFLHFMLLFHILEDDSCESKAWTWLWFGILICICSRLVRGRWFAV